MHDRDHNIASAPTRVRRGAMTQATPITIDALLKERRVIDPPEEFRRRALVQDEAIYREAERDLEGFWAREAERLTWYRGWTQVLKWDPPWAKWFLGGRLNVSYNCLDRHLATQPDRVAYYWEGEPGDERRITYRDLYEEVCRFANGLKQLGVRRGDRVAIYLGMIPELPIAMLACARIGAAHSVVFGGFAADALRDRINDAAAEVLITADGGWRRGQLVPLKVNADAAIEASRSIRKVVVVRRTGKPVAMDPQRDVWYDELVKGQAAECPPEDMDAEDPLFILYTSGTTGKPKGILHTTGGYLVGVATTHRLIFDIHSESDVYWCAADIGWVTGHSYIVYGPLANHTTSILYEGAPDFPDKDRLWSIAAKYRPTILYTAPTAIRAFMKWGPQFPERHDLGSLRLLGTVGEPINPEAWMWYWKFIGGGRCPIVDTWWQTETGMILITPLPGITTLKPGSATKPFPGVEAAVYDEQGNEVGPGGGGYLVLKRPWPAMLRGIYKDDARYQETYWSRFGDVYFAGDGARIDEDGDFWLLGRVDDVMNVSGHRISTIEVESALVDHPDVAEAAVCSRKDAQTGEAIVAYVTLKGGRDPSVEKLEELRNHVGKKIGPIAKPANLVFTPELPKTRSGKIMRRLLRDVAEHRPLGDTTTLADPAVVDEIKTRAETEKSDDA